MIRTVWGLQLAATQCHDGEVKLFINSLGFGRESLMAIVTVGIDLANNVFGVHGVDEAGDENDAADAQAIFDAVARRIKQANVS